MADRMLMELLKTDIAGARVAFDEPMDGHTSLHLGGPAEIFITPGDPIAVATAIKALNRHGLPSLPLGGGTNLLVKDGGIEGAVLSLAELRGLEILESEGDTVRVRAGSGVPLQELVRLSGKEGLRGIEGLAGIPGQLGGAIAGNAGAYGCEIKDALVRVTVIDGAGSLRALDREDIPFAYRSASLPEGSVVLEAELAFSKDEPQAVAERIRGFLREKKERQPIGQRSAGCVFRNPEGAYAGKLIEEAGCKGLRVGDIEVSGVHANFFINKGRGRAEDFLMLMETVSERVARAFGVMLEPEIKVVGV